MASSITSAAAAGSPQIPDSVRKQAQDFEGVFLNTLMKEMFSSLKTDSNDMGGGFGEETWRSMQAEQMANSVAQAGGIGLADSILPDLLAMQEANQTATSTAKAP